MFSLVGNGSHGSDILAIAKRKGLNITNIFDDDPERGDSPPADLSGYVIYGVNYPWQRREMDARFTDVTAAPPLIDDSAIVGTNCTVGGGAVVAPLASLLHSVALKSHVHVNTGVQIVRAEIGSYSTLAPGAIVCGDVTIGECAYLGAGSIVCDRVTIGDNVIIGAAAIVPPLSVVPSGATVKGVWKN